MRLIGFLLVVFLLVNCANDEPDVPKNNSLQVTTISAQQFPDGGVELFGKVSNMELSSEYGFVLSNYEGGTYNSYYNIIGQIGLFNGEYSTEIWNDLIQGETYFYNAVARYDDVVVFGEEKSFVSTGSASPLIETLEPNIAHVGDTITITGKYFSDNFNVYFDDKLANPFIESDTLIKAIVPFDYYRDQPYSTIKIKKSTQEETVYDNFSMYQPTIDSVEPYYAYEKDTITIHGNHFNLENLQNQLSMDIYGNYSSLQIIESSRTHIKFVNAGWWYDLFPKMKLKSQFQTIEFNDKFQALMPTITGAEPDCINYGETFTIYGENFPSNASLSIGEGSSFSTVERDRDHITLTATDGFYSDFILNDIVMEYLGETIVFEKEICVDEPWIKVSLDISLETHNYNDETYGVVYQNNNNFITVAKLNTSNYQFESVNGTQLPEEIRYSTLRRFKDDKLYVYDTSPSINKFYSFDYFTDTLIELAPFPGNQRVNGLMAAVGDYIYLGLGRNNAFVSYDDIWRYSINNNTWEFVLTYPGLQTWEDAISKPLTFVFDNRLFFSSGQVNTDNSGFWEIDINNNTLISKANFPLANSYEISGTILGTKGYFESYYLYEYDSVNDTWTTYQDINGIGFSYGNGNIFVNNNTLYKCINTSASYYTLLFKMNMSYLD